MDRLSDLPDSIIHHIISLLGTEEACRTTVLSKRWTHIWSTGLILDFQPCFFVPRIDGDFADGYVKSLTGPYDTETIERLVNFIETTMRRYLEENLSLRKFRLDYPTIDQEMAGRIGRWIGIALRNQVESLSLSIIPEGSPSYELPAILFSAKSLTSMKLGRVRMPYFENLNLMSLQLLDLSEVDVDEHVLHEIIKSCPLEILQLHKCTGITNISIPSCSKLEFLHVAQTIPIDGTILVDTSSFQRLTYIGDPLEDDDDFPVILTPASKKNLRKIRIFGVVLFYIFSNLVSELPSIETMSFFSCVMPENIKIASKTLTELGIHDCDELVNVALEAPMLDSFCYNGELLSSVINSHSEYNAYLHLKFEILDTQDWLGIKKLLSKSNGCCKILSIILSDAAEIKFNKDQLSKIYDGPLYDLQELKLSLFCSTFVYEESECKAAIDGLLWCCRPDILALSVELPNDKNVIRTLLDILEKKVKYWKHPLKRIEIEGTNCSPLFSPWNLDLRLRLHW